MIGALQATLDAAGAWAEGVEEVLFDTTAFGIWYASTARKKRLVDCSGAAWLETLREVGADVQRIGVTRDWVFLVHQRFGFKVVGVFPERPTLESIFAVALTDAGAHVTVGVGGRRRLDTTDLDESLLTLLERMLRDVPHPFERASDDDRLVDEIDRRLAAVPYRRTYDSTVIAAPESDEERRKVYVLALRTLETRLGAPAGVALAEGGRSVWWKRGAGAVALWEAPCKHYRLVLRLGWWSEGQPTSLPPTPSPDETLPPPPERRERPPPTREEWIAKQLQLAGMELSEKCAAWAREEGVAASELIGLAVGEATYVMRRTLVHRRIPRLRGALREASRRPGHLDVVVLLDHTGDHELRAVELQPVAPRGQPLPRLTAEQQARVDAFIEAHVLCRRHMLRPWMFDLAWNTLYVACGGPRSDNILIVTDSWKTREHHRPLLEASSYRAEYDRFCVIVEDEALPPAVVWVDPVRLNPNNEALMHEFVPLLGPAPKGSMPSLELVRE
jgi:hypothetical protein